jgi:hypothetical protein
MNLAGHIFLALLNTAGTAIWIDLYMKGEHGKWTFLLIGLCAIVAGLHIYKSYKIIK